MHHLFDAYEKQLNHKCMSIPYAKNILAISGVGENTLCGILAEMGDITRFDDVKEIQKLSGLGLVACSSSKHKGETKISHRGRKRLRYWLFQAAKSAVAHAEEFKELHVYYTTRRDNPLKKMQSLSIPAGFTPWIRTRNPLIPENRKPIFRSWKPRFRWYRTYNEIMRHWRKFIIRRSHIWPSIVRSSGWLNHSCN